MYITTTNPEVEKLLACYSCFHTNKPIGYFSSPISTGIRYYDWLAKNNDKKTLNGKPPVDLESFQEHVIKCNIQDANTALNSLVTNGDIIVNPASAGCLSGWEPEDYANLWRRVIELNIDYVVFNNGWSYSDGCAYEFYVAQTSGKKCFEINKHEISLYYGKQIIKDSLAYIKSLGFTSNMLEKITRELGG